MKKIILVTFLIPPFLWPMEPPLARSSLEIYKQDDVPVVQTTHRISLEIEGNEETPEVMVHVKKHHHPDLERNEGFYLKRRRSKKEAVLNVFKSIGSVAARIACVALRSAA